MRMKWRFSRERESYHKMLVSTSSTLQRYITTATLNTHWRALVCTCVGSLSKSELCYPDFLVVLCGHFDLHIRNIVTQSLFCPHGVGNLKTDNRKHRRNHILFRLFSVCGSQNGWLILMGRLGLGHNHWSTVYIWLYFIQQVAYSV